MKYIILSAKHSTKDTLYFWRANDAGYTSSPFNAGIYDELAIKNQPDYYNNGHGAIAVPLTEHALRLIGFTVSVDWDKVESFFKIKIPTE